MNKGPIPIREGIEVKEDLEREIVSHTIDSMAAIRADKGRVRGAVTVLFYDDAKGCLRSDAIWYIEDTLEPAKLVMSHAASRLTALSVEQD